METYTGLNQFFNTIKVTQIFESSLKTIRNEAECRMQRITSKSQDKLMPNIWSMMVA